jgi:presenilin 1
MMLVVVITRVFDPSSDPLAPPSSRLVQVCPCSPSALPVQSLTPSQTTFALAYNEQDNDSVQQKAEGSLLNAAYFIGMVVGVTVVLLLLYKYRCMKIIYSYLMFSVFSLLFFTGGVLLGNLILRFGITVDWLTFVFILANFGALGSFAVFFTAPSIVKQSYLVCVSVIMAWSLSKMPEWTNWTILIALAVYDLFAVLSPCGPLKALVEMSQSRNEPIPGLVYEADAPESRLPPPTQSQSSSARVEDVLADPSHDHDSHPDVGPRQRSRGGGGGDMGTDGGIEMQQVANVSHDGVDAVSTNDHADAAIVDYAHDDDEEERDGGVKLGLGDFVFYSVLVARCAFQKRYRFPAHFAHIHHRAASTNMTVVVTTFGAIVFGLCSTLVLLNIVRTCSLFSCPSLFFVTRF